MIIFTIQIPGDTLHLILLVTGPTILIISIVRISITLFLRTEMRGLINICSVSQGRRCYCACDWYGGMKVICIYILLPVLAKGSRIENWLIFLVSWKRLTIILVRFGLILVQPFCFVDFILNICFVKWLLFFFFGTHSFCY